MIICYVSISIEFLQAFFVERLRPASYDELVRVIYEWLARAKAPAEGGIVSPYTKKSIARESCTK